MKHKIFEIRDSGTMFMVLCVDMNPAGTMERAALRRYGYPCDGRPNILLTHLTGDGHATNDPWGWGGSSTYQTAHDYIIKHWSELQTGDVVDVDFIRGDTLEKKKSEVWLNEVEPFTMDVELAKMVRGINNIIPEEGDEARLAILSMAVYIGLTISRQPDDSKEYLLQAFSWAWDNFGEFADRHEAETGVSVLAKDGDHAA